MVFTIQTSELNKMSNYTRYWAQLIYVFVDGREKGPLNVIQHGGLNQFQSQS